MDARTDPRTQFAEFAQRLNLDVDRFNKDVMSAEVATRITADRERSAALGLDRTPVVFINGRRAHYKATSRTGCGPISTQHSRSGNAIWLAVCQRGNLQ